MWTSWLACLVLGDLLFLYFAPTRALALLSISIYINLIATYGIVRKLRLALTLGIAGNLAILVAMKLFPNLTFFVWPLGLSFYTLRQIGYLLELNAETDGRFNFLRYLSFVLFFPSFLIGPITRYRDFTFYRGYTYVALFRIAQGLVKKVLLADALAIPIAAAFDGTSRPGGSGAWLAGFAYTMQIYLDFSGYMDIVIGAAMLLGIRLPENFNRPYKASSLVEFWTRWHITLSGFLTAYVYTPLIRLGTRVTIAKSMLAATATMLISGMWHGSGWNYLAWGGCHGTALALNQFLRYKKVRAPRIYAWPCTFLFLVFTFVLFRAPTLKRAGEFFWSMIHPTLIGPSPLNEKKFLCVLAVAGGIVFGPWERLEKRLLDFLKGANEWNSFTEVGVLALFAAAAIIFAEHLLFSNTPVVPFIYRSF